MKSLNPNSTGLFKTRNGPRGGGAVHPSLYFDSQRSYDLEIWYGDIREKVVERNFFLASYMTPTSGGGPQFPEIRLFHLELSFVKK